MASVLSPAADRAADRHFLANFSPTASDSSLHDQPIIPSKENAITYGIDQYTTLSQTNPASSWEPTMPITTGSQSLLASLPSFMSVFGDGLETKNDRGGNIGAHTTTSFPKRISPAGPFTSQSFGRESSAKPESTDSSPTNTISTMDSALTEPSSASSPESPTSLPPLSPFKTRYTSEAPAHDLSSRNGPAANSFPTLPGLTSPGKKMRNMKNLSVNTLASTRQAQLPKLAVSSLPPAAPGHPFSAPPTPFAIPPKPPKKRPSNLGLTITTPEAGNAQSFPERPNVVPPTPLEPLNRSLNYSQTSSPMFSPTVAPEGGMRLPPFRNPAYSGRFSSKSRPPLSMSHGSSFDSSRSSPSIAQTLDHVAEENDYELPLSREAKSPAYPEGPVCIYDPHVFLYLEPTKTEAADFDVILNVAKEVLNPFTSTVEEDAVSAVEKVTLQAPNDSGSAFLAGRDAISEPQTAVSEMSFRNVFDTQEDATRTLPATPKAAKPAPEYIHILWDHNTNVVDDLMRLCELIDNRVLQGKRVLVHCQCGVSRSASLIVAYGIYKSPQLTVQEAYDAVKDRSRWIGPNMNLIYQLSEFKSKLQRISTPGSSARQSWRNSGLGRSSLNGVLTPDIKSSLAPSSLRNSLAEPSAAPLEEEQERAPVRANSFSPQTTQSTDVTISGEVTPGPSSAPPDMQWSPPAEHPFPPPELPKTQDDLNILATPNRRNGAEPLMVSDMQEDSNSQTVLEPLKELQHALSDISSSELLEVGEVQAVPLATHLDVSQKLETGVPAILPESETRQEAAEPVNLPEPETTQELAELLESESLQKAEATHEPVEPSSGQAPPAETQRSSEPPPTSFGQLPGGFSSLLARRQAPQNLPLRGPSPLRGPPVLPEIPRVHSFKLESNIRDDVPETPSILSPRAMEFTASPFHRTVAGDLAGASIFEQGLTSPKAKPEDPRSPAQRGEAPITRSIFDVLD